MIKWRVSTLAERGISLHHKGLQFVVDPWMLLGAAMTIASILWWLSIMNRVQISIVYPAIQAGAITVTLLLSLTLLQERISSVQGAGIALVIFGVILLSRS